MSAATNTFEHVRAVVLSAHAGTTIREKVNFYDSWAENYDKVRENKCAKLTISAKCCLNVALTFTSVQIQIKMWDKTLLIMQSKFYNMMSLFVDLF